ncbi:hypothetical protein DET49_104112 [Salegentibacter sp. 24]|uniref:hypothetical protein n=1 Tax=Salegentibacter sp. 24 TaxID=2183986 RepID=UPI00106005E7|nr:hypothetical protein [Salegentibacter sp. 24]TDN93386.1 hypothetical protein DET49_104112 [Salegentibacter sp. 24]
MIYKKTPGKTEIIKTKGDEGEEFVNNLSHNAYLKYWCYPNPKDLNGDKKEICDLLILFYNTAIIISVKNYQVKGNHKRFQKKVIEKSSNQLFGAEKKLFKNKEKVIIEHPEKGAEEFNPSQYKKIYRITVSVGEDIDGYKLIDHNKQKGSVTIFNRETFESIIEELDTIKDLTEYLEVRDNLLLENVDKKLNCSERDLLAHYLTNERKFQPELYSKFEETSKNLEGRWENYLENKSVFLKKLEDEKSYFIDDLIKNDVLKVPGGEQLAKELMGLSRFERRIIAQNLFEMVEKYQDKEGFLGRRIFEYNGIGYLIIYYPPEKSEKDVETILLHAQQLYSYFHQFDRILLLAATTELKQWKFGLFQATELNTKIEEYLKNLADKYGWFKDEKKTEREIKEYPD